MYLCTENTPSTQTHHLELETWFFNISPGWSSHFWLDRISLLCMHINTYIIDAKKHNEEIRFLNWAYVH